jgi:hypothetical protein
LGLVLVEATMAVALAISAMSRTHMPADLPVVANVFRADTKYHKVWKMLCGDKAAANPTGLGQRAPHVRLGGVCTAAAAARQQVVPT